MTTELNTLKQLISTIINETDTTQTILELQLEAEHLPDIISSGIFELPSAYQIKNHICLAQAMLVTQADHLCRHLRNAPRRTARKALIINLNLLKILGERFPEHFNSINPLPKAIVEKLTVPYRQTYEKLKRTFERYLISEDLAEITLYPLAWFLSTTYPSRYCDLIYLEKYLDTLQAINFRGKDAAQAEELLCSRLVTLNYNGLAFMDYLTYKVAAELKIVFTKQEKRNLLKRFGSKLKSIPVMTDLAFDQNFPPIHEALNEWIVGQEEELQFLKEKSKPEPVAAKEREKIYVSAGVLAFMTRLFKMMGFYKGRGPTQIVEHIIATYTSKNVDSITKTSFLKLYKKPTESVARALRRILNKMVAEIDFFLANGRLSDQAEKPQS